MIVVFELLGVIGFVIGVMKHIGVLTWMSILLFFLSVGIDVDKDSRGNGRRL